MAFSDGESPYSAKIMIGLALSVGIGAVLRYTPIKEWVFRKSTTPERVEQMLNANPNAAVTLNALKTSYPDMYKTVLSSYATGIQNDEDPAKLESKVAGMMKAFVLQKGDAILHAPAKELKQIAKAQSDMLDAYGAFDPIGCGRMASSALDPSTIPASETEIHARLSALTKSLIHAAKAGETNRQNRNVGTPSAANIQAYRAMAVRGGLTPAMTEMTADSNKFASAPPTDQCNALRIMTRASANLPDEQSAEFTALSLIPGFGGGRPEQP
jgi:hypothetical protein